MVDAIGGIVLNYLTDLMKSELHLIKNTKDDIGNLENDFRLLNAFLKDSVEKRIEDDHCNKEIVREIREVAHKLEDIIDRFVRKAEKKGVFHLISNTLDLRGIGQEVQKVRERVQQARQTIPNLKNEHKIQQTQHRPPRKKDVVGFEDEAEDLIKRLTTETDYFAVTSLIGMVGLGKTTLAWKVFMDPVIFHKFPIRIWISISQDFSDKDIFLSILKELTTVTEEIKSKKDHEIADLVKAHLNKGSFLIVMDDVWETGHWRRLDAALPKNNKGKVLITSRHEDVGNFAETDPDSIKKLRYFNDDESWKLLRLEALHTLDCPSDLENVGQVIAKNCGGLPLAIVIIGGILSTKSKDPNEWKKMSNVSTYLNENDPEERMRKYISLSYERLPHYLRSCFLYLGIFPEDYEIRASKLIRLWIGEGFIQQSESYSLEETAEKYLEELINRNLVKSERFKHNGKVKACRIHDTLRDFCRTEAAKNNLVKEIKYDKGTLTPSISDIDKYRRLSIHSNCLKFIELKPLCPNARSFSSFSKDKFVVDDGNTGNFFAAFKFLKVLDVEPFEFKKIDSKFYKLATMRYLVLYSTLASIPAKFDKLWNIQTLVFNTTSRTLEVNADIWKMKKLRYFKTNASANLPKPSKSGEDGNELQTLDTISVESCTPELCKLASKLKNVGIRGNLSLLFNGNFTSLGKMEHIEKLKLIHDLYPYPSSETPLRDLPQHNQFPSGLMSLTLCATYLSWDAMSTLRLLKKLEVLKLKEKAFMGSTWDAVDKGFKCLQLLQIEDTDLIVWNASSLHYPKLRSLVLRNCEKLLAIPFGMAEIQSLQSLELYRCGSAADSAKAIKKAKKNTNPQGPAFMLTIFPPQ